jgi:hypothetical protein
MYETESKHVKGCVMYATRKPSNRKLGLYMPRHVPSCPQESVSMDFIGGLPMSRKGHDYLYVVVGRSRKMCVLVPCKKQVTGEGTGHLFLHHVWVNFGLPTSIVSSRDS